MSFDPDRQVSQIYQCLVQDKKTLGFFLGAGCPYSIKDEEGNPLIPDINGLTDLVKGDMLAGGYEEQWESICTLLGEMGEEDHNIENILSRVRGIKEYVGNGELRGMDMSQLDNMEKTLCENIIKYVNKGLPETGTPYHKLSAWIGAVVRRKPVEIFTTNYDLLAEQALETSKIAFFDGFSGSRKPFFDPHSIEQDELPSWWARLWKLHGSINWSSKKTDGQLDVWRSSPKADGDAVIHPSHLKYEQSRKMPYLAMMDRMRKFLMTPSSVLVISGYSFRDEHINDVLVQSLQGSSTTAVFALLYGELKNYPKAIKLASSRNNLSLIAEDGAVIGTKRGEWLHVEDVPETKSPGHSIKWEECTKKPGTFKAKFLLGDFGHFGEFLHEISGIYDEN